MEELQYAIRRDQEGRQSQGLSTIFKPLKERYGKTDESQWTTCGGFHTFGTMKEALRGRIFSSDEEVTGTVQNWLKTQLKSVFLTVLKEF
jgi:hypothetical protein